MKITKTIKLDEEGNTVQETVIDIAIELIFLATLVLMLFSLFKGFK